MAKCHKGEKALLPDLEQFPTLHTPPPGPELQGLSLRGVGEVGGLHRDLS